MKVFKTLSLLLIPLVFVMGFLVLRQIYVGVDILERSSPAPVEKYDVVKLNLNEGRLEMFWEDGVDGDPRFSSLRSMIDEYDGRITFATNGGMFDIDGDPIGLYIEDGVELKSINQNSGYGNFHLEPNGVFYISEDGAAVTTTRKFLDISEEVKYATQSGPMLVFDGKINEQFTEGSENLHIRSGVCAVTQDELVFIISNERVNFFEFASEFLNRGCTDALYLDGFVSKMYAPDIGRIESGGAFGVVIGFIKSL
jgi:uncharacterized protein YigE (DUF2233 family)